ncbi:protein SPEAR3 [Arachis stenosperma]|uniref:protein SPEAR3 n=1 Tax=Arachis stenosperma TaxID=217475 RepID=UPI0025ACF59A|nr:protein SPEAR3 [Arachis stenosperma]
MGSSYFGEPNMNNESSRGGSSRKGKKNNQEKQPKQPQRGLGVAQLEKIRLHGEIASTYNNPNHPPLHHHHHPSNYPSNFTNEDPRVQTPYYSSVPSSSSFSYSSSSTSYSSPSYGFQPNVVMGLQEYERTNMRYGDSQTTNTARWEHANAIMEPQHNTTTIPFLSLYDSQKHRDGSSSQNSESSDNQEPDLELRLSL